MVGDADLDIFQERVSLSRAPAVVSMVWDEARRQGADSFRPWPGLAIMDDHWPLLEVGVPCIDVIDFDYPYWHTHGDTPERCSADARLGYPPWQNVHNTGFRVVVHD